MKYRMFVCLASAAILAASAAASAQTPAAQSNAKMTKPQTSGTGAAASAQAPRAQANATMTKPQTSGTGAAATSRAPRSQPDAKVTKAQASATALKARPGKISDSYMEQGTNGSSLFYTFEIQAKDGAYLVRVDAITGKVLENRHPTEDDD